MQEQTRYDGVDGLRGLCAFYVMLSHFPRHVWSYTQARPFPKFLFYGDYAHFAVTASIAISGFCLCLPIARNGWIFPWTARRYYLRRVRRIAPPYYVSLGLSVVLILALIGEKTGSNWDLQLPLTWGALIANLVMQQDWWHLYSINGVFWSLAVEEKIYVVLPFLAKVFARLGVPVAAFLMFSASFLLARHWDGHPILGCLTIQYWGVFALGALGATIVASPEARWQRWRNFPVALLIPVTLFLVLRYWWWPLYWRDIPMGVASVATLITITTRQGNIFTRILSWRPLAAMGLYSYSLYLIHQPLQQLLWQYVVRHLGLTLGWTCLVLVVIGVPFCLLTAYWFYRVFERPFTNQRGTPHDSRPSCICPQKG